jgi:hypothetical protein
MARIPWWSYVSASSAPVVLVGGWTIAATRQPASYDPIRDTLSALAAHGASDRWIMTSAFAGVGVCHLVTALGLRPARNGGRWILAGGGAATILVAVFAQPERGNSVAHTVVATIAFCALGAWPLAAFRRSGRALLTRTPSLLAGAVLLGLVGWFAAELHGERRGLAERAAAGAQALWPLAVVVASHRSRRRLGAVEVGRG